MYQFRDELACLTYFYIIYSVYLHSNTLYESMNPLRRPFSRNFSLYTYALISMNTLVEQTVAQLMDVEIRSFPKEENLFFSQHNSKYEDQGIHSRFLTGKTGSNIVSKSLKLPFCFILHIDIKQHIMTDTCIGC